jgi:hypothetical protein
MEQKHASVAPRRCVRHLRYPNLIYTVRSIRQHVGKGKPNPAYFDGASRVL